MTHYYCSTFSKGYAYKGLVLYNSLLQWDRDFHFYFLCLDDEVKRLFENLKLQHATVIPLSAVEAEDHELRAVRKARNDKEYIWTAKASVMLYILKHWPEIDHIAWLDGDTCFYADPEPIFSEWGQHSIMLTRERWRQDKIHQNLTKGIYNTGFMGFKRDTSALRCLRWFRKKLLEWCYDRLENGLWSDQLYVNDWPKRFTNVGVIKNLGVNVGPYIIEGCRLSKDDKYLYVDGQRLIFYHSYGFRYYDGNEFDLNSYPMTMSDQVKEWVYLPYIEACNEAMAQICAQGEDCCLNKRPKKQFIRNYFNLTVNSQDAGIPQFCTVLSKTYLVQGLALYNSLMRTMKQFRLWVLCVDETAYDRLASMRLPNITLISVENLKDERLGKIRRSRQLHEFCWTLKPILMYFLLKNNLNIDRLLYLDADLYFFQTPEHILRDWGNHSVYITSLELGPKWTQRVGKYSAGLVGFRRDKTGLKCLKLWRRKCRRWCYDRHEKGLWADQKYLDTWPEDFPGVKVSGHKGINTGPWNIRKGQVVESRDNVILYNDYELICYHFSGFEILSENKYELCNRKKLPLRAQPIYAAYIKEIQAVIKTVGPGLLGRITAKAKRKLYNPYRVDP